MKTGEGYYHKFILAKGYFISMLHKIVNCELLDWKFPFIEMKQIVGLMLKNPWKCIKMILDLDVVWTILLISVRVCAGLAVILSSMWISFTYFSLNNLNYQGTTRWGNMEK